MANVGLLIIIAGWILQLFSLSPRDKKIQPTFVLAYAVGVAFLVFDGLKSHLTTLALLNFLSLASAGAVFYKLNSK